MTDPFSKEENIREDTHEPDRRQCRSPNPVVRRDSVKRPTFKRRTALGVFFDCYEKLRFEDIESAKRDLERCRKDRNFIMCSMNSRSNSDGKYGAVVSAPVCDSSEPQTKRRHCDASCSSAPGIDHDTSTALKSCYNCEDPPLFQQCRCQNLKGIEERVVHNMDMLAEAYSSLCNGAERYDGVRSADNSSFEHLSDFGEIVDGVTLYGRASYVAPVKLNMSNQSYLATVSSLEFSPADNCIFSMADVTHTIQVFDIRDILERPNEGHYPDVKLRCDTKISSVAWSPRSSSTLVNSDYDGSVTVWDVDQGEKVMNYTEHERRCWSVCFARTENHICASGSIDCTVKIWNLNMANSVMTIKPDFVVCAVDFGFSRNELAVGSADRSVYLYDLRRPASPLKVFAGHHEAVSYVRYLNPAELVTASTDNSLRVWNIQSTTCTRVLQGHKNEKHFVGLSSSGDHIITGSEDNRVYLYHKKSIRPIFTYDVDACISFVNHNELPSLHFEEPKVFVSAVAWRPDSNMVILGNNAAKVQIIELH